MMEKHIMYIMTNSLNLLFMYLKENKMMDNPHHLKNHLLLLIQNQLKYERYDDGR